MIEPDRDRSVLELAQDAGWNLDARCGGQGSCGLCKVMLGKGCYHLYEETFELRVDERREVLSCQTRILSRSADIFLPRTSLISVEGARIADEMNIPAHTHNPRFLSGYGIAVDLGTTTVVVALIDLTTGNVLGRESLYNQQLFKADDVIARISLCSKKGELEELQDFAIARTLNPLIRKLCSAMEISPAEIVHVALSGNTVMMHIFFGLSPVSIGTMPFEPLSRTFESTAKALSIDAAPNALVEAVPAMAGFVGGDITSDLHIANLAGQDGLSVLVDIGTNGEMVASRGGVMTACATAAGPAFEGAGILSGMRATARAIESIRFDAALDFEVTVIGGKKPLGLCGSAIIDFVAEGRRCGLINFIGRLDVDLLRQQNRYTEILGMHACLLVDAADSATGEPIVVTEGDIAEVLKAKAAIYGGLKSLLEELNESPRSIDRLVLAGGFARHINIENAICLGLLPDLDLKKYEVIGNGSLAGAALVLLSRESEAAYAELMDRPRVITLNQTDHFTGYYEEALAIPNLETDDFPSVSGG